MKYLVNANEMKQYDKNTTEHFGVPGLVLMERAALAFTDEILQLKSDLTRVLVVCGTGNNGGDGLAIARLLKQEGYKVDTVLAGDIKKASEQNRIQQQIMCAYQYEISTEIDAKQSYTTIIDALFGVGLSRNIEGDYAKCIAQMNGLSGYKIAVDIASGISADHGTVLGTAFRADCTITFAYEKIGMLLWPGNEYSGKIIRKKIGIGPESWLGRKPGVAALEDTDISLLKARKNHSNKGTYGKLLVIAGSVNMAGAACLCGKAAYASGCGLVRIITPEENRIIIQTSLPEAVVTTCLSESFEEKTIMDAIRWADAIVCGPGIGQTMAAEQLVACVLKNASVPVVLDADALNILSKDMKLLLKPHTDITVTPHLGEMSRMTGDDISYIQTKLIEVAEAFARQYNVICVLKDERTVTCVPDEQIYMNLSGNNGMAAAGSGDVLSGVIGGLLAQGMQPRLAAPLGVFLHGKAGDVMAEEIGQYGLMASDLVDGIKQITRLRQILK